MLGPTRCIVHRGIVDRYNGIENSLSEIEKTITSGADGVEFDINHTQDGIGIVYHDKILKSYVTSKPGMSCPVGSKVENLKYDSIQKNCMLENGEEIPVARDVFELLKGKPMMAFLDFKDIPSDHTIALIREYYEGMYGLVYSIVMMGPNFESFYTINKRMPNPLLVLSDVYPGGTVNGFDGVDARKLSQMEIRLLKEKGKIVALFDVNDLENLKKYMNWGANFITTDRIDLCLQAKNEIF